MPDTGTREPTVDHDAIEALKWLDSGMPDSAIGYGPDAPKLTPDQLAELTPASYVSKKKPRQH